MESIAASTTNKEDTAPCALQYRTLEQDRISLRFWPEKLCRFFRCTESFLCKLVRKHNVWTVKADTCPVTCKSRIYQLFYKENIDVHQAVYDIYDILEEFTQEYNEFKTRRLERYRSGDPDIILFSDEEDTFLTPDERTEYRAKRETILKRMIPPPEILLQRQQAQTKRTVSKPKTNSTRKNKIIKKVLESSTESEDDGLVQNRGGLRRKKSRRKRARKVVIKESSAESEDECLNLRRLTFAKEKLGANANMEVDIAEKRAGTQNQGETENNSQDGNTFSQKLQETALVKKRVIESATESEPQSKVADDNNTAPIIKIRDDLYSINLHESPRNANRRKSSKVALRESLPTKSKRVSSGIKLKTTDNKQQPGAGAASKRKNIKAQNENNRITDLAYLMNFNSNGDEIVNEQKQKKSNFANHYESSSSSDNDLSRMIVVNAMVH